MRGKNWHEKQLLAKTQAPRPEVLSISKVRDEGDKLVDAVNRILKRRELWAYYVIPRGSGAFDSRVVERAGTMRLDE